MTIMVKCRECNGYGFHSEDVVIPGGWNCPMGYPDIKEWDCETCSGAGLVDSDLYYAEGEFMREFLEDYVPEDLEALYPMGSDGVRRQTVLAEKYR